MFKKNGLRRTHTPLKHLCQQVFFAAPLFFQLVLISIEVILCPAFESLPSNNSPSGTDAALFPE